MVKWDQGQMAPRARSTKVLPQVSLAARRRPSADALVFTLPPL